MSRDAPTPSPNIDRSDLLPPLQRMFGSNNVTAVEWDLQAPDGLPGVGGGAMIRFTGTVTVDGQSRLWSLIRKRLLPPANRRADPSDQREALSGLNYWKRESLFYQSALPDGLPEGFAAPRCFCASVPIRHAGLWLNPIL